MCCGRSTRSSRTRRLAVKNSRAHRLGRIAGIAVLTWTFGGSVALPTSGLHILPSGTGTSASYVFDFSADYGGYSERYLGLLDLKQIAQGAVIVSGRNDRVTQDEILHLGVKRESRTSNAIKAHFGSAGIVVPDTASGVADQVFDYNELLSLLGHSDSTVAGSTWRATTMCWISNTLTAPVPVRVSVREDGNVQTLTAQGERRLQAGAAGSPLTADIAVSVNAVFRAGTLTNAALYARETYGRRNVPAGGGVYHWTVNLKGKNS